LVLSLLVRGSSTDRRRIAYVCNTDEDCSLNGVCRQSQCTCDKSWIGDDCGILNLLPAPLDNGYNRLALEGISSWGGTILRDPTSNLYHLIAAEFVKKCPLQNWVPNSRVIRATATSVIGPYKFAQEVLPPFAHNPTVSRTPDGSYLLFHIGSAYSQTLDCTSGQQYPGWDGWPYESGISLHVSTSLTGQWTPRGVVLGNNTNGVWDTDTTNPSPLPLQNGTVILIYRGCETHCNGAEMIGVSVADSWKGPYSRISKQPIFMNANEDPFIWIDARGKYHLLMHSLESGGGFSGPKVGRHAYSHDGISWHFGSRNLAYNTTVILTDGKSKIYFRRERPQVYFESGNMVALVTGVQEQGMQGSYTCIQPIAH